MMLTVIVLICAASSQDCTPDHATTVMRLPLESALSCMMAQRRVAATAIGRDLRDDERVLVICPRM